MRFDTAVAIGMAAVMLLTPIAGTTAVGAVPVAESDADTQSLDGKSVDPQVDDDLPGDFLNTTDDIDIWERAILPLRLDRSDDTLTTTSVDNIQVMADSPDGEKFLRSSANNSLVVYRDDATVDVFFDLNRSGPSDIDGEEVHLIAAKVESSDDPELPSFTDIQTLEDFVENESDNKNVIFENVSTETVDGNTAGFKYDFSESDRGAGGYAFMAVHTDSGQGVNINNNNLSVNGNISILGADTAFAQTTESELDTETENEVGETVEFDVDANLNTEEERVEHAVALWNESKVANEQMTIVAPGEITNETEADEFQVNHTIEEVDGVQNVDDDVSAFGRTLTENEQSGVFELADMLAFLANEGEFSEPETNRVEQTTVINASTTSVNETRSNTTIDVETNESWDPGEYVAVHMAVADGDLTRLSSTKTNLTLVEEDDGPSTGGPSTGDDGDDEPPAPPEALEDADVTATEATTPLLDPGTEQQVAEFETVDTVETITFETDQDVGEVQVSEIDPDSDTVDTPGSAVAVQDISPPDTSADTPATIEFDVSRNQLDEVGADPEELRVFRGIEDEREPIETSVEDAGGDAVTITAETPGFSVFSVSAVSEPDAAISVDSDAVETGDEVSLSGADSETKYGEIVSYDWSVAGETLTGENVQTAFDESGEYTVEVTVTNDAGETDTATADVVVETVDDGTTDDGTTDDGTTDDDTTDDGTTDDDTTDDGTTDDDTTDDGTTDDDTTDDAVEEPGGSDPAVIAVILVLALIAVTAAALARREQ